MIVEEKTISSDRIYTGKVISLKVDTVEIENKGYQKREIVEHQGAVAIVALTDDDKVVLIKQFRKPIEQVIWEIPAGKLEIGENPKDCAIRELKENSIAEFANAARNGFRVNNKMTIGSKPDGGYTVPEDILTAINTYRESKKSLKDLVTVEKVTTSKA